MRKFLISLALAVAFIGFGTIIGLISESGNRIKDEAFYFGTLMKILSGYDDKNAIEDMNRLMLIHLNRFLVYRQYAIGTKDADRLIG